MKKIIRSVLGFGLKFGGISWLFIPIKALLKRRVIKMIKKNAKKYREQLKEVVMQRGPGGVNDFIDKWQLGIISKIRGSWVPDFIENIVINCIQEKGNELQKNLLRQIEKSGPVGVDTIFDWSVEQLVRYIKKI